MIQSRRLTFRPELGAWLRQPGQARFAFQRPRIRRATALSGGARSRARPEGRLAAALGQDALRERRARVAGASAAQPELPVRGRQDAEHTSASLLAAKPLPEASSGKR